MVGEGLIVQHSETNFTSVCTSWYNCQFQDPIFRQLYSLFLMYWFFNQPANTFWDLNSDFFINWLYQSIWNQLYRFINIKTLFLGCFYCFIEQMFLYETYCVTLFKFYKKNLIFEYHYPIMVITNPSVHLMNIFLKVVECRFLWRWKGKNLQLALTRNN